MFYLTMHFTHFIYGYMVSDIWFANDYESSDRLLLTRNRFISQVFFWKSKHFLVVRCQCCSVHAYTHARKQACIYKLTNKPFPVDYSDNEIGNLLPPLHGLLFPISSKGFYMHHPTDRIAHTTVFVTPVMGHWLE